MAKMKELRAVIFSESGAWIAQCIEVNVAAQGATRQEAIERLQVAIETEASFTTERHGEAFKGIGPAPRHFLEMWKRGEKSSGTPVVNFDGRGKIDLRLIAA